MRIRGITSDSRRVRPGYAFVAVRGHRQDGHQYIAEAIARGASIVYVEEEFSSELAPEISVIRVKDGRRTLARLAHEFYGHPSDRLHVVGVTGTNGKTTTTQMIRHIFQKSAFPTGLIGSVEVDTGLGRYPGGLTTPDSVDIHRYLAEMRQAGLRGVSLEVSSHGLAQSRVGAVSFDVAVHTNLSPDHLDFHLSFHDYVATKALLFAGLPPDGRAILNADDSEADRLVANCRAPVWRYGRGEADLRIEDVRATATGISFTASLPQPLLARHAGGARIGLGTAEVRVPMLGLHNAENAAAALLAAVDAGVPLVQGARALADFPGARRRLQVLQRRPYTVIDDYAHNQGNYRAALAAVTTLPHRWLLVAAAIRGSRGTEVNRDCAEEVARLRSLGRPLQVLLSRSQDVVGEKDQVEPDEEEAFLGPLQAAGLRPEVYDTLEETLLRLQELAGEGDLALLLGAQGMDAAQDIWPGLTRRTPVMRG